MSKQERVAEQDAAAGGRAAREVCLPGRVRVTGSVALRVYPSGRRIYAYLRWWAAGKTRERYVGEVTGNTREQNLTDAWRRIHTTGLLENPGSIRRGAPALAAELSGSAVSEPATTTRQR